MKNKFIFILIMLSLAGCAARPELSSPEALLAALKSPSVPSVLKGTGEFRFRGPEGLGALRFAFLLAAPDRLKVQALSPLGNLAFLLVQDREKLQIYVPQEHSRFEDGEARSLLEQYLPPEITTPNLVYFLSGRIPDSIWGKEPVSPTPAGRVLKLKFQDGGAGAEAEYSRRNLQLKTLKVFTGEGKISYLARFKNYRTSAGFLLPTRIEFVLPGPGGESSFRIDLLDLEINPELAEDSFQIPAPEQLTP
ncbi:MAG: DUF4292 domain-containing protein [bacterium]|nr:DUF4292 domain-containing protein [bacterium]